MKKNYQKYTAWQYRSKRRVLKKKMSQKVIKKRKISKKNTVSHWKKELWTVFSKYIRLRDSDKYGYCQCISCGARIFWKKAQAGHFISKANGNKLYFDEQNVNAQCYRCNINLGGNSYVYSIGLNRKYGEGTAEKLWERQNKSKGKKFTIPELQEKIVYFNEKIVCLSQGKN